MIKSLIENGMPDEQTKEYIKELDLNLAERDISTRRIERYRNDVVDLKKELNQWRRKCTEAEKKRDELYHKFREVQRDIEQLEDERKAERDRSLMNRSSPNLSACSSMVGGQIPPPPPPADITYDEIFNMTGNQPSPFPTDHSNPYSGGSHRMPPPPPPPPLLLLQDTGDKLPELTMTKTNHGSTGSRVPRSTAGIYNGTR